MRHIAAAGWRWVHWCHQWDSDFLYGPHELAQIERWLAEFGLRVLDIHGSAGQEKSWGSPQEYERLAGVDLVINRVEMASRLGCGVVIMHAPDIPADPAAGTAAWDRFRRSLDEVEPHCRRRGVRLALENMPRDNFDTLGRVLACYGPDFVGICYDSGHGQIAGNGLDRLEAISSRLIATHLNDNDGKGDIHQPLFAGKVDWPRLASILGTSGYDRQTMTVEAVIKDSGIDDDAAFLRATLDGARRFAAMAGLAQTPRAV